MRKILIILSLILCGSVLFGQSPRIRLNQITKDSLAGSVVLSGSDSNMVYSRDFFLNLTDSVLILFGDTISTSSSSFTVVNTDLTLTGNGTTLTPLKVDTAIIATITALSDSLAGIISSVNTDLTLTGDGSVATPLKVDTSVIATIKALADSVATRGTVTSVAVAAGTGISVSGSPITTSGIITVTNTAPDKTVALTGGTGITTSGTYPNFTITNSAPDQTVSITGAGINAVTGTYPNFTITGTEVDGSTTNELQTISTSGAAGNITLSNGGGTLNLNVNDADASATNEGSLSVGAGGANSSTIVSNTSGSTAVTIAGGSNVTVTESGSTITIASTAGGTGTVTDITAGTFLSGGTITTSGTIALDTASAGLKTYIGENIGTVDLASQVTGTLPVANGGTGATTLTANKVLVGNGTSAVLQPTNLHWDNTNSRLGIGTISPTVRLDVSTTSGENFIRVNSAANQDSGYRIAEGGTNKWLLYNVAASDAFAIYDNTAVAERLRITSSGNVGIGTTSPTAFLHLKAGTASANTAPLKFTSGTNLTTPEAGAIEWNGTNLFLTNSGATRQTINQGLTGSATLDFGSTNAQSSADLTITVTGASDGDVVSLGLPNGSVNANTSYSAWVSAANTVTVRFNNYSSGSVDPASGTFKVFVTKF